VRASCSSFVRSARPRPTGVVFGAGFVLFGSKYRTAMSEPAETKKPMEPSRTPPALSFEGVWLMPEMVGHYSKANRANEPENQSGFELG
jgi:hypothetical protein